MYLRSWPINEEKLDMIVKNELHIWNQLPKISLCHLLNIRQQK